MTPYSALEVSKKPTASFFRVSEPTTSKKETVKKDLYYRGQFYQTMWRHIRKYITLHSYCCENLKPKTLKTVDTCT
jgi:hypothetical protein